MSKEESNVAVVRRFFGNGRFGRKVEMQELKNLTQNEREELGNMVRVAEQDPNHEITV